MPSPTRRSSRHSSAPTHSPTAWSISLTRSEHKGGRMEFVQEFPIAIIDEDIGGTSATGRGMQQLAAAIEKEGFRVVSGIGFADAEGLARVFNNESCWVVSVDGA